MSMINYDDVLIEIVLYSVEMIIVHRNNHLQIDENNPIQSKSNTNVKQSNFETKKDLAKSNNCLFFYLQLVFEQIYRFSQSKEKKT